MSAPPVTDTESWMRQVEKDGALAKRRGNPFPRITALEGRLGGENLVINGAGRVNQRGATSGASLASGAYFLDRWRSTAATNAVTWTGSDDTGRVMTVPASKTIATTIERRDVQAGTYTLNQAGTAQGRVYNSGGSAPAFADLPLIVELDGTADVVVEFAAGTVSKVVLVEGGQPATFTLRHYQQELDLCRRYYRRLTPTANGQRIALGFQYLTTAAQVSFSLGVALRTSPTLGWASLNWTDAAAVNSAISALALASGSHTDIVTLNATFAAVGAQFRPGALAHNTGGTSYLELIAEL